MQAVDALRGLVMIIMALDHTRDFFHVGAMSQSPTDLATTTTAVFLTRWVTHVCAPVFMFLAGTSAWFWRDAKKRTTAQLSRFLCTRGLWLLVVEVVVMRLGFDLSFDPGFPVLLITLFALGGSMILLAALIHLPRGVLAGLSAAVIVLHNALDPVRAANLGAFGWLWTIFHEPGVILTGGPVLVVGYPLIPWFAVMALGYCFGGLFMPPVVTWQRTAWRYGVGLTLAFLVVRGANLYGDPVPWTAQPAASLTALQFLNTTKYPASLSFLLMTLGPALACLAWLGGKRFADTNPLLVFGRVPLFYFVVHFFLLHLLLMAASLLTHGSSALAFMLHAPPSMGGPKTAFPADFGYPLWVVYAMWLLAVGLMYPLCRWFGAVRRRRTDWWLSYL